MAARNAPRKAEPPRSPGTSANWQRGLISAFLLLNLFAIITWAVPMDSPLIAGCRDLMKPYLIWTGLFQKWDMFAPDPSKLNNYVTAAVTFRDGRSTMWTFPRMENLGYVDKYFQERYRKFANDNLRLDGQSAMWPDTARYIARRNNNPANPPVTLSLIRLWSEVPPPTPTGVYEEAPWQQNIFFRYSVLPKDLQ